MDNVLINITENIEQVAIAITDNTDSVALVVSEPIVLEGLQKLSVGVNPPANPSYGDLWVQII